MKTRASYLILFSLVLFLFQACELSGQQNQDSGSEPATTNSKGEILTLKAGLENPYFIYQENRDVFLYVNVVAGKDENQKDRTPLNLSLVIDRSGSMESENKLEFVKKACQVVIDNLSPSDRLSIVAYDDKIDVPQTSQAVENKTLLRQKIDRLTPGNMTNLGGGMLEGFNQAESTYESKMVNRVLLLSDGLANRGITSVQELQQVAQKKYRQTGVSLSTFGVGLDYNEDLMTNLAEYGRGNYYFIDAADNIPAIFQKELQGLLSVVAQNAQIEIDFPDQTFELKRVYGYDHLLEKGTISIDYNDIFSEEEKAVLIHFRARNEFNSPQNFAIRLTYDEASGDYERQTLTSDLDLSPTDNDKLYAANINLEVSRQRVLFLANANLEEAIEQVDQGNYDEAKKLVEANRKFMEAEFEYIRPDSALQVQFDNNAAYGAEIDDIEEKTREEVQMMQKSSKSTNYQIRKKKQNQK